MASLDTNFSDFAAISNAIVENVLPSSSSRTSYWLSQAVFSSSFHKLPCCHFLLCGLPHYRVTHSHVISSSCRLSSPLSTFLILLSSSPSSSQNLGMIFVHFKAKLINWLVNLLTKSKGCWFVNKEQRMLVCWGYLLVVDDLGVC